MHLTSALLTYDVNLKTQPEYMVNKAEGLYVERYISKRTELIKELVY